MPKVTQQEDGGWAYKCTCGYNMALYTDGNKKPKKLVKCFDCQEEFKYDTHKNNTLQR